MALWHFTSESVTEGHPDKICDQVSDAILDAHLAQDPASRVACECCATTGVMMIMGEVTSKAAVDCQGIARRVIENIGYTDASYGFDAASSAILVALHAQSPDIAQGVDMSYESRLGGELDQGAGDQGMMFGFACSDTPELMPLPIALSHALTRRLALVRKTGELPWLRPDGKSQVTVKYDGGKPVSIDTVVISTQHSPDVATETIRQEIIRRVIKPVIPANLLTDETKYLINPTGRFVIGGPQGDSGLTGRKIIVDTYGGFARHGGGAFSGKDPSKVDRSAAYMARYAAKNVVASGLATRCEIELSYAIGVAHPVSLWVETAGTGLIPDSQISKCLKACFDFRPAAIIHDLGLRRPLYAGTASYGHFGRADLDLPWEKTDRIAILKEKAGR